MKKLFIAFVMLLFMLIIVKDLKSEISTYSNQMYINVKGGTTIFNDKYQVLATETEIISYTILGIPQTISFDILNWTEKKYNYTYKELCKINQTGEYYCIHNVNVIELNTTINKLLITKQYLFIDDQDVKLNISITNKNLLNLNNFILHYKITSPRETIIHFNGTDYESNVPAMDIASNLNDIPPILMINGLTFYYPDLIQNGADITDFAIGTIFDSPNSVTVGTSINSGIFLAGSSISFDPQQTSYSFPTVTVGQFTAHANLKLSDNARANATAVGQITNASSFTFTDLPTSAIITEVWVRVEGRCYAGYCDEEE